MFMQRKVTFNPAHGGFDVDLVLRVQNPYVVTELKKRMENAATQFPRQSDLLEKPENFCIVVTTLAVNLEQVDQLRRFMDQMHDEFDDKSFPVRLTSQGDLIQQGLVNRIPIALLEPSAELKVLRKRAKTLAKELHLQSQRESNGFQPLIKLFAQGTSIVSLGWAEGAEEISFVLPPASLQFMHRNAHGQFMTVDDEVLSQFEVDLSETKVAVGVARASFFQAASRPSTINKLSDSQPLLNKRDGASGDDDDVDLQHEYTDSPRLQNCCRIL
jgi:hypothetical protein